MAEVTYAVAVDGLWTGPARGRTGLAAKCHCDHRSHDATVPHVFRECGRALRLWALVLAAWGRVTGERKLRASDARVTLLGDRSGTWLDDSEQSEFGTLREPWAVLHAVTLWILKKEHDSAMAPGARRKKTAAGLYRRVQTEVMRIVADRWTSAVAAERDRPGATDTFRRRWVAPGLVEMRDASTPHVVMFERKAVRRRRSAPAGGASRREQEYAPPSQLPPETVVLYTDGSCVKPDGEPATAGWGVSVLVGPVDGLLDAGAREAAALCGPLHTDAHTGTEDGVEKLTNNTAELMAIVQALRHARESPDLRGRPALIRYDSKYAALITCGVWRARSNKALASTAQAEWALARAATAGRLWLSHVKGHSNHEWNDRADRLADRGRRGERLPAAPIVAD